MRALLTSLSAAVLVAAAHGQVVIQPTAIQSYSTQRSCVFTINTINGNGLSNAAAVVTGSVVPAVWPSHGTSGCSNMWHTTCIGQDGSTCEGGPTADLTPFIVFDLGAVWDLTGFRLWNHNQMASATVSETNRGIRSMEVSVSSDGTNFSTPVAYSSVTQGAGLTTYTGESYALPAAGVRYVRFQVTQNWGSTAVTGMSEVRFIGNGAFGIAGAAASPSSVELCGPQNVLLTANMTGIQNATGLAINASGGPLTGPTAMNDGGADGDATAGDGVYSVTVTFPAGFTAGTSTLTVTASAQGQETATRNADVTVSNCLPTYVENGDAGELIEGAAVASGNGILGRIRGSMTPNDTDLFRINICDGENFSATTFGGTNLDTQLFLFNTTGVGVAFNDDVPTGLPGDTTLQSTLNAVVATGGYYLAITLYNRDAVDASAQLLWANAPFDVVRAPDGPGAANPFTAWTGTFTDTGDYSITLTGACFVSQTPICPADLGVTGGTAGSDGLLDNNDFIVFIDYFFNQNPIADRGTTGGVAGTDGLFNNNDFIVFIDQFFQGCGA